MQIIPETLRLNIYKTHFTIALTRLGFGKKDALHIACAFKSNADFFITVDKGIIRKANLVNDLKIVNPINFISYLEDKNET